MSNYRKVMPLDALQCSFIFNENLLDRLDSGDRDAIFEMGIAAFDADKLGFAMSFFKLANREGHDEAPEFINLIREIAKRRCGDEDCVRSPIAASFTCPGVALAKPGACEDAG